MTPRSILLLKNGTNGAGFGRRNLLVSPLGSFSQHGNFSTSIITNRNDESDRNRPTSDKGFFARLWDKYSIQGQRHRIVMGERLFRAAQRRATDPTWYGPGRIGRQFRPRHAILTMHVWLLHKRLISDTVDPHASLLIQEELFDILWNDTRARIRAEGVNELTVNKHLKDVQQVTFQHCTHYDHAFSEYATDPEKRFQEIALAVWMHILLKDEEAYDDHIKRLAAYVEYQYQNIMFELPDEYFQEGRINWGSMPDFSKLRDNNGKILEDVSVNDEDRLPGNWIKTLTDAGEVYYWNPVANMTQWERPTKP